MDIPTILLLAALVLFGWLVFRRRTERRPSPSAPGELMEYLTPQPLTPSFRVADWDGYSGMQMALSVELADGACYPVLEAGTIPPASATQTFSTSRADQTHLTLALYAGLSDRVERSQLVQRLSIGPIPLTGEAIRQVEVVCTVDAHGRISTQARRVPDGSIIPCEVIEQGLAAIPIGR